MKYLSRTTIEWAVAIGLAFGVAATGGSLTVLDEWYYNLVQPWFKPPDLLFGPVWTVLFSLMAWSGVLAWRSEASDPQATAARRSVLMRLWAFNALTNVTWSYLYFYLQRPDSIYLLIRHLNRYNKKAALMLWPYLAWVSFAGALNVATVLLNRA